jgi:hypothetical protein
MSIEDRLTAGGAAWRESQPPVTVSPVPEVRRKPVLWLPLTAAAATVAVALGASVLVSRDDSPAPLASGVVAYADLRAGEADVPAPLGFTDFPPLYGSFVPTCDAGDAIGSITVLREGRGRLSLTSRKGGCLLVSQTGLRVRTVTTEGVAYTTEVAEPRLWSGGGSARRGLGEEPLLVDLDVTGQCLSATTDLTVEGVVPEPLRVPVEAVCADAPGEPRFEAGPMHTAGEPHAPVPDDRAGLRVEIVVDGPAPTSGPLDYRVRLSNPTGEPISLDPCPAYRTGLYRKDSRGESYSGSGGRLNCDAAPDAVPAGGSVVFAMRHETTDPDGIPGPVQVEAMSLRWAIAGPPAASADVPVTTSESTPTATPTIAPTAGPGTTTSLRADLDDDGSPDLATVNSTTGLVVLTTASGTLPALRLEPSVTLEVQGVLDLPGHDGLLVSTTSAGAREAAQTADVIRVVGDRLEQLRYSDGDREPVQLEFNNGRGDQWAGVRCTATGIQVLRAALETSNTDNVVLREQDLTVGAGGVSRGEIRVKGVPQGSTEQAVATAARLTQTRCDSLTTGGLATGERSVTYAR